MTSQVRRAAKSDLKALRVVRDLSEKKRHTFSLFIGTSRARVVPMFLLGHFDR